MQSDAGDSSAQSEAATGTLETATGTLETATGTSETATGTLETATGTSEAATGTLEAAVRHAEQLLTTDPSLAAEQAEEILKTVPDYPPAWLIIGVAQHCSGDLQKAAATLQTLVRAQPNWAQAHFESALLFGSLGRGDDAIAALRKTVTLKPTHPQAWRYLADHLMATGDTVAGDAAYARHVQTSAQSPQLQKAALAMVQEDVPLAERLLKDHLKQAPTDVPAIRMLAEVAVRCGQNDAAEKLLLRCLELAPGFAAARYNYAVLLHRSNAANEALEQIELLVGNDPKNPSYRNLYAVILSRVGEYERSSEMYQALLDEYPSNAKVWLSYGHVLKTEGRQEECINAYRRSIERNSDFGEAYWSLANLKTFRFNEDDLAVMQAQLHNDEMAMADRVQFHFALGKASEDVRDYATSFKHYEAGNALHNEGSNYSADLNSARTKRLKQAFNRDFFDQRVGSGCDAVDPIFIVSMPRAGSTLLEQILSSHSQVEGTTELPDIISLAKDLRELAGDDDDAAYERELALLSPDELRELGEQYMRNTRIHRKTDRPYFIDKMPNNFLHIGMIQLILPNAKIIDARRHPLGCCFSNFKQYYARGQSFSYNQGDMGRFYHDYVELMTHYEQMMPGRIHRVHYEDMINDTEKQVRQMLDYCGLPFESKCLRFFENTRPVRTASSEQVRQPIYTGGMEQWRNFEGWLGPMKTALGPVLQKYPEVPLF